MSTIATRLRGYRAMAVALAVCAMAAVGCGSSNDSSTGTQQKATTGSASATSGAPKNLTVCFDGAAPPQEFYTPSHQPTGSEVEILAAIASKANYKLKYSQLQFNGLISALLSKHCDIVAAGMFVKPERLKVIDFAVYSINGQSIMVQKGNAAGVTGYDDSLAGKTIGMTAGYATIPVVQKKCAEIGKGGKKPCKISQFGNATDTYQALKGGKVDAVIDATTAVAYFASQNASTFQLVKTPVFLPSDVGFGVRKTDPALLKTLRQGVDEGYADGSMCKILAKWNIGSTAISPHHC